MKAPSKELLSDVLGVSKYLLLSFHVTDNKLHYFIRGNTIKDTENTIRNNHKTINIYELMHKCKEWAFDNGYSIVDGIDTFGDKVCYVMKCTGFSVDYYYEQTDNYSDVFKACEWIKSNR